MPALPALTASLNEMLTMLLSRATCGSGPGDVKMQTVILSLLVFLLANPSAVQKESKSDPCSNVSSQSEMTICWGKEYKAADTRLNQVYRQLVSMLGGEEKLELKKAQTAWLKYRDANCEFAANQYKGGSMRPMIYAMCLAEMTDNRTTELRSQITDRKL
jgi:uncharacterized protein YecT (DUF1311 family)